MSAVPRESKCKYSGGLEWPSGLVVIVPRSALVSFSSREKQRAQARFGVRLALARRSRALPLLCGALCVCASSVGRSFVRSSASLPAAARHCVTAYKSPCTSVCVCLPPLHGCLPRVTLVGLSPPPPPLHQHPVDRTLASATTMKVSLVVFAATLALLAAASSVHGVSSVSPWQAFWTDSRHGGMIATCVEGTSFWGVYSNIGYLQGNISADGTTASGTWYESGHVDGATGGFVWTLNSNLNGFTGVRRTQYIRCAPAIWSETKITTSTPSRTDCLRVYDNSTCAS